MDIGNVMDQIGTALDTISELRVNAMPTLDVAVPAANVDYPQNVHFDETYGRGMDRITITVTVMIGVPTERQTRDLLTAYCDGSGASSVKAVLESASYSAFHTIRVSDIDFDVLLNNGIACMAAIFTCDIAGRGTA